MTLHKLINNMQCTMYIIRQKTRDGGRYIKTPEIRCGIPLHYTKELKDAWVWYNKADAEMHLSLIIGEHDITTPEEIHHGR